ncbi:beta-galactosidase [Paenibacillus baekrokdamisoli]|uniref:Beta-galactosidase n=1 Tax=Paenibacillus baekrokdamisoli TaxID=1712516 RepID=A0A3G9JCR4_9BACL|nr:beta-galactosidase [Paenibacillus baekrokdamisoli]MBB3073037.1 beta-galactosidase [Paenibacillus baekrokdamisoli]BBH21728.1 beta-galactosidase [Paenibacillus baekrokdamisoli]
MNTSKLPKMLYGGDYNPEQWDRSIWPEDMRMLRLAGMDIATINVFSWSLLQPSEDSYQFETLDAIMDMLHENGIYACLATSTGAHPAWMAHRYPDVLRTDFDNRRRKFGGRHNSCPNSPTYRKYSTRLASKLAERYKDHPALLLWHVSNEYGGECYCDHCAAAFRIWLQKKYVTLDKLNEQWNTRFWGHTFYDWEEIVLPNSLSEQWSSTSTCFQGISLDYTRFNSDGLLDCYKLEYEAIKQYTPDVPVTTNLMGTYKPLDYFKWAKHMDIVSWDNYPSADTPFSMTAMTHDLMRGIKGGAPFLLMEQTPSQQNWQDYNTLKRPGVMRLWSYQAVAHGADSVMFFQLRRSVGACEKYHGALIEHVGHEHTRVFRECAALGDELQQLGDQLLGSRLTSKIAIMYDWDNRWAIEYSSGPTIALQYVDEIHKYYDALYQQGIQVDIVSFEDDLSPYDVVLAPVMYMVKPGMKSRIESFVQAGGSFVTTYFSGIVNENDIVTLGGYPGELRNLLGIWAEEIDALFPDQSNRIIMKESLGTLQANAEFNCSLLCDLIHSEGADVLAEYGDDFYAGMPVLTRNRFGSGEAWYLASSPDAEFLQGFLRELSAQHDIHPLPGKMPNVEVTRRDKDGRDYLFIMNHNADSTMIDLGSNRGVNLLTGHSLSGQTELAGRDLLIVELI